MRDVAGLTGAGARIVLATALLLATPVLASAHDPTTPPDAGGPPTCAERFPDQGPAGVDLRLGCIVSEVVGLYTPGQASPRPTISTYALVIVGLVVAVAGLILLGGRLLARRAGEALAPVTPDAWWMCPRCRSVNGAAVERCYSCGATRPADPGATLVTDERPATPQSFGRGKHG